MEIRLRQTRQNETLSEQCAKPVTPALSPGCRREKKEFPGLILIDGGIGQLSRRGRQAPRIAADIHQPVASMRKKREILYVLGQEDEPIVLEQHSPVVH